MKPSQLVRQLAAWRETRPTVAIWGAPGLGKSEIVAETARNAGEEFLDFRALLHDPSDLKFPIVNCTTVRWVQSIFPTDPEWKGIILLDELPNAPPLMQSALLQLTLDRKLGDYRLPEGAWVIAAGNRPEDRAGAGRIIQSLSTRFMCQITLQPDLDDWQAWAVERDIHVSIRSYLAFRPENLHNFDAARAGAQPTPRTWSFLSRLLPTVAPGTELEVYAGVISEGPAAEYIVHRQIHHDLPDIDKILANPEKAKIPKEPAIVYATLYAIGDRCRGTDYDTLNRAFGFCKRLPREWMVVLARLLLVKANVDKHGIEAFDVKNKKCLPNMAFIANEIRDAIQWTTK